MSLSNEHINQILQVFNDQGNDGLPRSEFFPFESQGELIVYLIKEDLIETEDDPDHFYLTDRGYEATEHGWYDVELENEEEELREMRAHKGVRYSQVKSEEELKREKKRKKVISPSLWWQAFILSSIVGLGTYLLADQEDSDVYDFNHDQSVVLDPKGLQRMLDSLSTTTITRHEDNGMCPLEQKRSRLERQFNARVVLIQLSADSRVYFEGKETHKDSIHELLSKTTAKFTQSEKETFQVALLSAPETAMKIISDVKAQVSEFGDLEVNFQMTDSLYVQCESN